MRREGFEMMVGPPKVIEKTEGGERLEPFEMVDIDIPEEYSGAAISLLNERKGSMLDMGSVTAEGQVSIQYEMPARGMTGVKSKLLSASRGMCVMTTTFAGYKTYAGDFGGRSRGNCGLSLQAHTDIWVLLPGPRAGAPVVLPRQVVDPVDGSDLRLELGSCRDVAVLDLEFVLPVILELFVHGDTRFGLNSTMKSIVAGEFGGELRCAAALSRPDRPTASRR